MPISSVPENVVARALTASPVDTKFRLGIWHRDRLTWRGFWVETKVFGKSWITQRNKDVSKFIIIGRARSGTTLLTDLLNEHPDVTCDREMLHRLVVAPATYLDNLAQKSRKKAYGSKLLSYQMVQVQRFHDPVRFLADLHRRGFRFIHITRGTFDQTFSLMVAQTLKQYHRINKKNDEVPIRLDPEEFCRRLEWSSLLLEYEKYILRDFPHLSVSYEHGLSSKSAQANTATRLFDWIGVRDQPVHSELRKILPSNAREVVENYDEIVSLAKSAQLY